MRTAMTLLTLSLAFTVACKKKQADPPAAGSATGSAVVVVSPDAAAAMGSADMGSGAMGSGAMGSGAMGSGAMGGDTAMPHQAGNCPSTVLGSTTTSALKGKDIVLTITATDKDAIAAIQKRTTELLSEKADDKGATAAHDQKGSHGGSRGICPVYFGEGGKATSKPTDKGAIVTITPKDKPEDLKATIDGRITKAAEWVKANIKPGDQGNMGAVGGGKGEHGSTHSGSGDSKGKERGTGGGAGTGGGGSKGTGGGAGSGSAGK